MLQITFMMGFMATNPGKYIYLGMLYVDEENEFVMVGLL